MLAPWRQFEIYFILFVGIIIGEIFWLLGRKIKHLHKTLTILLIVSSLGIFYSYYSVINTHFINEYPVLSTQIEMINPTQKQIVLNTIQSEDGHRMYILQALNAIQPKDKLLNKADNLIISKYQFMKYKAVTLPEIAWDEDPYDDVSWNFSLHKMDYIVTLTRAYEETENIAYLQKAQALVLDWISDNTFYLLLPPSKFTWNDHTTALRLMNWLYFIEVWKKTSLPTEKNAQTIFRSISGHAKLLASDHFYSYKHNHGIDQDRALIAFSAMHPYNVNSPSYQKLALERSKIQFALAVSENGIHMEHTPAYHFYGMTQIEKFSNFLALWDIAPTYVKQLQNKFTRMIDYIPYIVKPDGHIVQIGDTAKSSITRKYKQLINLEKLPQVIKELITTGATNNAIDESKVFQEEGYAIIRDSLNRELSFKDSFYLFFTAGAHEGRTHRQADDLSFVMSNRGNEILIDPGVYSYKENSGRDYILSSSAHNTVIIDNKTYDGWDTTLDNFIANDTYTYLTATHHNYEGFTFERHLIYLANNMVIIIDNITNKSVNTKETSHEFQQIFHFAPMLKIDNVSLDKNAYSSILDANNTPILKVVQLGKIPTSIDIVKGQKKPMQGWHSIEHAKLIPAPTLISTIQGSNALFVTALVFNPLHLSKANSINDLVTLSPINNNKNLIKLAVMHNETELIFEVDIQLKKITLN
tara:strand:- start:11313 stop:13406 length:2094 start_codon:yes stop_codon:yes gene_type:complete